MPSINACGQNMLPMAIARGGASAQADPEPPRHVAQFGMSSRLSPCAAQVPCRKSDNSPVLLARFADALGMCTRAWSQERRRLGVERHSHFGQGPARSAALRAHRANIGRTNYARVSLPGSLGDAQSERLAHPLLA